LIKLKERLAQPKFCNIGGKITKFAVQLPPQIWVFPQRRKNLGCATFRETSFIYPLPSIPSRRRGGRSPSSRPIQTPASGRCAWASPCFDVAVHSPFVLPFEPRLIFPIKGLSYRHIQLSNPSPNSVRGVR
jgi:hypothetical protein